MKHLQKSLGFLILATSLVSCVPDPIDIPNFDAQAWKMDRYGCEETRLSQLPALKAVQSKFFKVSEETVMSTLGKPDRVEPGARMSKTIYYYLESNMRCNESDTSEFRAIGFELDPVSREVKLVAEELLAN